MNDLSYDVYIHTHICTQVESILAQNGDALLGFIHKFHKDTDNERMLKEKAELITTLEALSTAFKNPNSSPSIPSATADSKRRAADDNSNDATQTQADTPPATGVETMSPSTSSSSSTDAAAVDADAATASAPTEEDNSEANQHTLEPHKHMGQVDNVF
jgi:DNA mismatch repair ATPase MutL